MIDAKLHTENMPVDSVVPYLVRESFQEEPEATAKLQRAQLDYVQLNLYPVGLHDWWNLRREAERTEGAAFNLCRFHDTVLSYGPIPVPAVRDSIWRTWRRRRMRLRRVVPRTLNELSDVRAPTLGLGATGLVSLITRRL